MGSRTYVRGRVINDDEVISHLGIVFSVIVSFCKMRIWPLPPFVLRCIDVVMVVGFFMTNRIGLVVGIYCVRLKLLFFSFDSVLHAILATCMSYTKLSFLGQLHVTPSFSSLGNIIIYMYFTLSYYLRYFNTQWFS